jgi:hypothetical protein
MIQVYGHPRSGNHLLASLIWRHFYEERAGFEVRMRWTNVGHWSRKSGDPADHRGIRRRMLPYGRLLGGHAFPTESRTFTDGVYVMRDGRDVALSMHRFRRMRRVDQEELTLSEYLRAPLDWKGHPGQHAPVTGSTLLEHWRNHVALWARCTFTVRYESLVACPEAVLHQIKDQFALTLHGTPDIERPVGWNPSRSRGHLSRWAGTFGPEDLALYDAIAPEGFTGRWP